MEELISSGLRAVRSLFTPGMMALFIMTVLLTVAVLAGFVGITSSVFVWLGGHMHGHAAALLPYLGGIGSAIIAWFLFPGIMPVIASFFDERIADVIERHEYPAIPATHAPSPWRDLLHDMRFAATAIFLNVLVLPLYLLPIINLFLFYLLNGHLLGREFFVMAARRHLPVQDAEALRKRHGRTVMAAGMALTLMATIPILNLFAPFWGIAVMVHLYHRIAAASAGQPLPLP